MHGGSLSCLGGDLRSSLPGPGLCSPAKVDNDTNSTKPSVTISKLGRRMLEAGGAIGSD